MAFVFFVLGMSSYLTPARWFLAASAACIAPSANWPPATAKETARAEVAASNTRLGNAFMSALADLAALLELSRHGQGCSAVLTDAVGLLHLTARE